jgi:hypothetical protein
VVPQDAVHSRDHDVGQIHAWHGDNKAVFDIATGALIARILEPRQDSPVCEWIGLHQIELDPGVSAGERWRAAGYIEALP